MESGRSGDLCAGGTCVSGGPKQPLSILSAPHPVLGAEAVSETLTEESVAVTEQMFY